MMSEASKMEWFDKYRTGQLTTAEIATFQQRLRANPLLNIEYQDYLQIVEGIRQYEREALKAFLLAEEETPIVQMTSHRPRRWVWGIAAAILLLLAIPVYNYLSFSQNVYAKYQLELPVDNVMGIEDETTIAQNDRHFKAGKKALKKGKLAEAFTHFEQVSETSTNKYFIAQYELALLHIKKDNFTKAKSILNKLTKRPEHHFIKQKAINLLKTLGQNRFWF